jgi:hypothetical protein
MNRNSKLLYLSIPLFLYFVMGSFIGETAASTPNYFIFPTNSTLNGIPYTELIKEFWVWNLGVPDAKHPLWAQVVPGAENCPADQDGPVWFLPNGIPRAEGPYYYKCDVPFGKIIMIPVSLTECDFGSEGPMSDENFKTCAYNVKTKHPYINITLDDVKVDSSKLGQPIKVDSFNVTYPNDPISIFDTEGEPRIVPGTYPALAEGFTLFVHDLPVGVHKIDMTVTDDLGRGFLYGLGETTEVHYTISIK